MKVFVSGYWNQNLGDDLFLFLLCQRYPHDDFYTIAGKNAFSSLQKINNLHRVQLSLTTKVTYRIQEKLGHRDGMTLLQKRQIQEASKCDLYCELGGSLFIEPPKGMDSQYQMRQAIAKSGQPYLVIGSNFGPYYHDYQLYNYQHLFSKINAIWLRDRYSTNLFSGLLNISYAPDLAFSLNTHECYQDDQGYVLISVIDVKERFGMAVGHQYQHFLLYLIKHFIMQKQKVILMSFCANEGDLRMANDLERLANSDLLTVANHTDLSKSLHLISGAHQVIATRYHAMILSWIFRKPTFVLTYSKKMERVIQDIYPDQSYRSIKQLKPYPNLNQMSFNCPSNINKIIQQTRSQLDDLDYFFTN